MFFFKRFLLTLVRFWQHDGVRVNLQLAFNYLTVAVVRRRLINGALCRTSVFCMMESSPFGRRSFVAILRWRSQRKGGTN